MSGVLGGLIAAFPTPITGAFESIASASGTGSSGTITFSSIPSTYQHLQIRGILRDNTDGGNKVQASIRFNGISTTSYDRHHLQGDGASATAAGSANTSLIICGYGAGTAAAANIMGTTIIDIHNYASTTQNKTVRIFQGIDSNDANGIIRIASGLFRDTTAVSSISLLTLGTWATTTQFALYGIKGS